MATEVDRPNGRLLGSVSLLRGVFRERFALTDKCRTQDATVIVNAHHTKQE